MQTSEKLTVSIVEFGAKSGVEEMQTEAIQAAIDHCFLNGGGEVQIPEGEFYSGAFRLRSNVTLHLLKNAKLIASLAPEDYFVLGKDTLEPVPAFLFEDEKRSDGVFRDIPIAGVRSNTKTSSTTSLMPLESWPQTSSAPTDRL